MVFVFVLIENVCVSWGFERILKGDLFFVDFNVCCVLCLEVV